MAAAAGVVARIGWRAWLTIGAGGIAAFRPVTGVRFLVRLVDPPRQPLPLRFCEVVIGRGPFTLANERHLIARRAINVLVCKASGGAATEAKLIAAREFSLPVVMVRRPSARAGRCGANCGAGARLARISGPRFVTDEGVMKRVRWIAIIALSVIVQVNFGSAARAQLNINPFSAYYDNVARAAAKNDAEAVRG